MEGDQASSKKGIFLVVILAVIVIIIAFVLGGGRGIFNVIKWFLIIAFILTFIGFVFYIIYYLFFKKHRRDLTHENWKDYVKSARDNGQDLMNDLYLTGDKNHSSKRFMTILGYLRIVAFDGKEYDFFVGKKNKNNPFEEERVVMLEPTDHSDLVGDVFVYGISLIRKYGYYFLNNKLLDFKAVDGHIAMDTYRTMMYSNLGDMKSIVDRAIGLDQEYIKERQKDKLLKIPVLSGQEQK